MDITTLGPLLLMIWIGCFAWEYISPVRRKMRELEAKNERLRMALIQSQHWSSQISRNASIAQMDGADGMIAHFDHKTMSALLDWNLRLTKALEKEAD